VPRIPGTVEEAEAVEEAFEKQRKRPAWRQYI
jgi:hypothetical protein